MKIATESFSTPLEKSSICRPDSSTEMACITSKGKPELHEKRLRPIAAVLRWEDQREAWRQIYDAVAVRHRCWRAMLYRSRAELYRQWQNPDAARVAVANAEADVNSIDPEFAEHPFLVRAREAIADLTQSQADLQ